MVKKVILWVLVIACMVTIFMLSHQNADSSHDLSSSLLFNILDALNLFDKMPRSAMLETVELLHFVIRKIAHFSIYAMLGVWVYLLMRAGHEIEGKICIVAAPVICALYAISDEIHQVYVPGRSGEIRDVLIDTAGAVVGIMLTAAFYTLWKRRRKNG